nr:E3 ubiquitin-protein ligase UPL5 [Tanacetum cinerariifolium]
MESIGPSSTDVHDLNNFWRFMMNAIIDSMVFDTLIPMHYNENHPCYDQQVGYLYSLYLHNDGKLKARLTKMEDDIKRVDEDYKWILDRKDYLTVESRRHLVMMLLPEVTQDYMNDHNMLIIRSNLLAESSESITQANLARSCGPIFIQFTNEEAVGPGVLHEWFMLSLELEDLDEMLYGSESEISIDDWKAHTEYNGYKETDREIHWFWKDTSFLRMDSNVEEMSVEQRKVLLFFWTSVEHPPVEGFRGLASRLSIIKSNETCDRLPFSHTCFYEICILAYPSIIVMQQRLNIITQSHVACTFGNS